jgi:predicted DNA-binding transcriptional regulator AlpA
MTTPPTRPSRPASALAVTAEQAAKLFSVSRSTWWKMHSLGQVPRPIRLGRCTRWRRSELEAWQEAGCPDRVTWEELRRGG